MKFDTKKIEEKAQGIKFSVEKKVAKTVAAQVCLLLDKTGSFKDEYKSGLVQEVLQAIFPFALAFDPDKSLDLYTFHNTAKERPSVVLSNWGNYIKDQRLDSDDDWGGTYYAPPMEAALQKYGFIETKKSGGVFGFGAKSTTVVNKNSKDGYPVICYIVTDGDNYDEDKTEKLIKDCQNNEQNIYFMLIAIDNDGSQKFKFLNHVADKYDNCGLITIRGLRASLESGQFEELMFQDELVNWLKENK